MAQHQCVQCKKGREGRFTRRKGTSSLGWDAHLDLPHWYCYTCLPEGEGRGEDMPAKRTSVLSTMKGITVAEGTFTNKPTREEGLQVVQPLQHAVEALVVETEADYLTADSILSRIRRARSTWGERMEKIIRPIRSGLDEIYALNREVDKPLESLENGVKGKMKAFKLEEQRRLQAESQARQAEIDRLAREAAAKTEAATKAATPQLRGRLEAQATRAEEAAVTMAQAPVAEPVRGESSTTRPVKKPKVANLIHFLQGIVDGYIPEDCISDPKVMEKVQTMLNLYYKQDPDGMGAWPGVEIEDDIQIVGR